MPVDGGNCELTIAEFRRNGLNVDDLAVRLQHQACRGFVSSWHELVECIAEKRASRAVFRRVPNLA